MQTIQNKIVGTLETVKDQLEKKGTKLSWEEKRFSLRAKPQAPSQTSLPNNFKLKMI